MRTERKSVAAALPSETPETGAAEMSRILNQIGVKLAALAQRLGSASDAFHPENRTHHGDCDIF